MRRKDIKDFQVGWGNLLKYFKSNQKQAAEKCEVRKCLFRPRKIFINFLQLCYEMSWRRKISNCRWENFMFSWETAIFHAEKCDKVHYNIENFHICYPEKLHFNSSIEWRYFSLYFPPIPEGVKFIDLIEKELGDKTEFNFFRIKLDDNAKKVEIY